MMQPRTFSNLIRQVKECGTPWLALCGNGEPTLHPEFVNYVRQLAKATKFLSLTTNWQRVDEETIRSVVRAPVDLINISVDGGNKEEYEAMRIGGKFERLLANLQLLKEHKQISHSSMLINIRLMLRPSQYEEEQRLLTFWRTYGDVVSEQYVMTLIVHQDRLELTRSTTNLEGAARCLSRSLM